MINIDARNELIALLRSLQIPQNYKFVLSYRSASKEIALYIYQEGYYFGLSCLRHWTLERCISAEDYDDLLELVKKYPKFIETEVVIGGTVQTVCND